MGNKGRILAAGLSLAVLAAAVPLYSQPYWGWGPYWGYNPYYYPYYYYDPRGTIDLESTNETDQVYINGAYAGTVDDLDTIWLNPGKYNVKIVRGNRILVQRDVYVVSGEEVDIDVR
ncbi:MAG: PEGA domain-containing protein [Acidobacteria bacterium]|nr:PEGA domain-containing protein [Acidobacteriota bacterium]